MPSLRCGANLLGTTLSYSVSRSPCRDITRSLQSNLRAPLYTARSLATGTTGVRLNSEAVEYQSANTLNDDILPFDRTQLAQEEWPLPTSQIYPSSGLSSWREKLHITIPVQKDRRSFERNSEPDITILSPGSTAMREYNIALSTEEIKAVFNKPNSSGLQSSLQGVELEQPLPPLREQDKPPKPASKSRISSKANHDQENWQVQKQALAEKFGSAGWLPRKRLSPDALDGIRALHAQYPEKYTTAELATQFESSPEAIRRILKSKWRPNEKEEDDRRRRWDRRGEAIWTRMADAGMKPPTKWRRMGIGREQVPLHKRPDTTYQEGRTLRQLDSGIIPLDDRPISQSNARRGRSLAPSAPLSERIL